MRLISLASTAILLSIALTGCGGGDTTPLTVDQFLTGGTPGCKPGEDPNTSGCIPGSSNGDNSNPISTIITASNYIGLAAKTTSHIDIITSARPNQNTPIHLSDLLVKIVKKTLMSASTDLCAASPGAFSPGTIINNSRTVTLTNCSANGFSVNGDVTITNLTGDTNNFSTDLSFSNLGYKAVDTEVTFASGNSTLTLSNANVLTRITLDATSSSLSVTEKVKDQGGLTQTLTDTFNDLVATTTLDNNTQEHILDIFTARLDDSTTGQPLNIDINSNQPMHWIVDEANPSQGQLKITSVAENLGLTLFAFDNAEMNIQLDGVTASPVRTTWLAI